MINSIKKVEPDIIDRNELLNHVYQVYIPGQGYRDVIYYEDMLKVPNYKQEDD